MASIDLSLTDDQRALRAGVLEICKRYPGEYWRDLDTRREYPDKFVTELTEAGYLAALIPQTNHRPRTAPLATTPHRTRPLAPSQQCCSCRD